MTDTTELTAEVCLFSIDFCLVKSGDISTTGGMVGDKLVEVSGFRDVWCWFWYSEFESTLASYFSYFSSSILSCLAGGKNEASDIMMFSNRFEESFLSSLSTLTTDSTNSSSILFGNNTGVWK